MLRRIFGAALGAGICVGLIVALLQHVVLVPMILTAETYEGGAAHKHSLLAPSSDNWRNVVADAANLLPNLIAPTQAHDAAAPPAASEISPWRAVLTWIATILTSVGFALLLAGAFAVSGRAVDAREGLLWGLGGFASFALAPAFGLPPELPGAVQPIWYRVRSGGSAPWRRHWQASACWYSLAPPGSSRSRSPCWSRRTSSAPPSAKRRRRRSARACGVVRRPLARGERRVLGPARPGDGSAVRPGR